MLLLFPHSQNAKTGESIQTYSPRATCPLRCPFRASSACYAQAGFRTRKLWDRAENPEDARIVTRPDDFAAILSAAVLSYGAKARVFFRHNVAGDIAIEGTSDIDAAKVDTLINGIEAARAAGRRFGSSLTSWSYTHCRINEANTAQLRKAAAAGFPISYSVETASEAARAVAAGIPAVIAADNVEETKEQLKAAGLKSVQCLAQTEPGTQCTNCRLCMQAKRKAVVIFAAHGNGAAKTKRIIKIKKISE